MFHYKLIKHFVKKKLKRHFLGLPLLSTPCYENADRTGSSIENAIYEKKATQTDWHSQSD